MATMLGFLDDVFDIRWRHKLPIPVIASIPLLIVYYSERGATDVVVPLPLRWLLGTLLHLGWSRSFLLVPCLPDLSSQAHCTMRTCPCCPPSAPTALIYWRASMDRKSRRRSLYRFPSFLTTFSSSHGPSASAFPYRCT